MRICIYGPSRVGKTTLATILSRALCHKLELIHGDEYIKENTNDWIGLEAVLNGTASYIFDHISAPSILENVGIKPDISVGIGMMAEARKAAGSQFSGSDEHHLKQAAIARSISGYNIEADTIRDAISSLISLLSDLGMFPNPIENFIIKITSRCNLNCSYCYMYQAMDLSSSSAPIAMSLEVANQLGKRLAEHYDKCSLHKLTIIIHGGEPLALKPKVFKTILYSIKDPLEDRNVIFSVQTNGTRITKDYLEILDELGMQIGVSLDGKDAYSNRNRVYHSDAPAYLDIISGINTCLQFPFQKGRFGGVLCVVDPNGNGRDTYRHLRSLGLNSFDFLLRDEHHFSAPGGSTTGVSAATFLCEAFDEWLRDPDPCDIRLFDALICLTVGASYGTDSLGLYPMNALGVGVSGDWELLDVLRICFPDAWKLPYHLNEHSVSEVVASKEFKQIYQWQYDLSDVCLKCMHLSTCGGGYLPHRYHPHTMFRNASSHCSALFSLIGHITCKIAEESSQTSKKGSSLGTDGVGKTCVFPTGGKTSSQHQPQSSSAVWDCRQ